MNELTNSVRSTFQLSTNTLGYYFAASGEYLGPSADPEGAFNGRSIGWAIEERDAFAQIFEDISKFTNLTFVERSTHFSSDLTLIIESKGGEGALASLPKGPPPYFAWFDVDNLNWDIGVNQGGLSYVYFMHEIGHVLGLEHTHEEDFGGEVLRGVSSPLDTGLYGLNQGVFTVMGYNDGWDQASFDVAGFQEEELGHEGTFSPIDIALLQEYYGANTSTNSGNTTYTLDATNDLGTHFAAIWDTGGFDTIRHLGSGNANIDLRSATLDYTPTGGGVVSYVNGIKGGFTIAHGVTIENASGGSGNDNIIGNVGSNTLRGNAGQDRLLGLSGTNQIEGGDGSNFLLGGFQNDTITGGSGRDVIIADHLAGVIFGQDRIIGGAGNDIMSGGAGRDTFVFAPSQGTNTIADFAFSGVRLAGTTYVTGSLSQDFEIGIDRIELDGFSGLNASNIQSALSSVGGGAQFSRSGTTILFEDIALGDLTSDHFSFV